MTTPAEMVILIDEAIASKLTGTTGNAIKRVSDQAGISVEHYSMDELRNLRREYASLAAAAASTSGSLRFTTLTTVPVGPDSCNE